MTLMLRTTAIVFAALVATGCGKKDSGENKSAAPEQTQDDPKLVTISGTIRFLVSDADKGIEQNAAVDSATVFIKGFPDNAVTTDPTGAFTIAITLPDSATLTAGGSDYEVIGWTIIDDVKFGAQKKAANVEPNVPFAMGDIMIGYTQKLKFYPQYRDASNKLKDVDHRLCKIVMIGYEGKSNVMTPDTADGDISVDYLPPATYQFKADCDGYETYNGEFTVEFDPATPSAWVGIPPFELKPAGQ